MQTFSQRKSPKALCLSSLGFGLGLALQKIAFAFLLQMTETLKLRIVSLHPLPFTPANVFFISLGGLDFPLVLPSSSSQLPRASHNKPACLGSNRLGPLKGIPDICLWLCFSASAPGPVAGAEGQPRLFALFGWRLRLPTRPGETEPSSQLCQ